MNSDTINPEVLPEFFRNVKIVGSSESQIPKYREMHTDLMATLPTKVDCPVTLHKPPMLLATDEVKQTYQNSNFGAIKSLETKAQDDLKAVYSNVAQKKGKAWSLVESEGKQFYMTWSDTGSMWAYTEQAPTKTSLEAVVQIGTYSASTKIVGIHSYNLTVPAIVTEAVIALIVAVAVSGIVADGLAFAVTALALYMCEAAAAMGLESFSFTISAAALGGIAFALVFVVVFIGLTFLWNWINREYTIRLQVFNWDENNDYTCQRYYGSNTKIPGQDQDTVSFKLPAMVPANSVVTPPGFIPVKTLNNVCYYAIVIWKNDNTILEGLSMSLAIQQGNTGDNGITWAFDCPRFGDNKQGAVGGSLRDPKSFLDNAPWNSNPKSFSITAPSGVPVSVTLDSLSGADNDLYNTIININH